MDPVLKESLWKQFGAAIDMLKSAIKACPDTLWNGPARFWYKAYHTLFYLDYYLDEDPKKFRPPQPFTLSEFEPGEVFPDRVYGKTELLEYLAHGRKKCQDRIAALTDESSARRFDNPHHPYPALGILLYNMRHVQHHAGQLNSLLRQEGAEPARWISEAG